MRFSSDGRTLYASGYHCVAIWQLTSASAQHAWELDGRRCSAFAKDGSTIAVQDWDGPVMLFDVPADRIRAVLADRLEKHLALSLSLDGSTLATATSDGVRLWETATGRERAELRFHTGWVSCMELAPDGRTLAVGGIRRGNPRLRPGHTASALDDPCERLAGGVFGVQ